MGEGENKNVTIAPEDAYGSWNESLAQEFMMDSIPLDNIIESNVSENISEFSGYYPDVNINVGETFDYGIIAFGQAGIMNATITEVDDANLTYQLIVENGTTIVLPLFNWNVTFIVENDTAFNMHSDIEVNHTFTYGDYWGAIHFKVIDVNETAAKLAVNMEAPTIDFVDQTLVFELDVVTIYKTSTQLES
jgi:FKBP-type peptidyl-prolyl cis-trans isomerase 2